jgi:hypothetical protein
VQEGQLGLYPATSEHLLEPPQLALAIEPPATRVRDRVAERLASFETFANAVEPDEPAGAWGAQTRPFMRIPSICRRIE